MLEATFDVLVEAEGLAVLNETPFETLFRGADEMADRAATWIGAIKDYVPIDGDGAEKLVEACRRNSFMNRRLRSIYDSGHLANVDIKKIRAVAKAQDVDTSSLLSATGLIITDDTDIMTLLRLLNDDLFKGGLSGTKFAADRKRVL